MKLAVLGEALSLDSSTVVLDLASGSGDELAGEIRAELSTGPARYARYTREYLGWGSSS